MWHFYLSDDAGVTYHEIEEPTGWDSVLFTLKRGPESDEPWIDGADFVFSSTLTFVRKGARILKLAYDTFGIDADVRIRITRTGCVYQFDGFVDFSDYNENPYCGKDCGAEVVTVRIYKSGFSQLFKNRIDNAVDLSKQSGIDGNEILGKEGFELKLHSKEIFYLSTLKVNEFLNNYSLSTIPDVNAHTPPLEIKTQELEFTLQPSSYEAQQPFLYSGSTYPPGVEARRIYIKGRWKFTSTRTTTGSDLFIRMYVTKSDGTLVRFEDYLIASYAGGTASIDYTFPDGAYEDLLPDENLSINLVHPATTSAAGSLTFNWDLAASFLELSENSIITPSTAKVYGVFEAFQKITESITGASNSFASDFFESGCGNYLTITNGLNIRKMLDKNGNLFPVTTSFKDIYDAMDSIFCLGMRIEKIEIEGIITERVRVEHRSFFYQAQISQTFDHVPDVNMNVSLEAYYNELEIGYSKWQTEDVNGLDEFNSKRLYSLPVKNVKKKLSRLCGFIASGYMIEQTRRQQFKEKPTSDYATDNDMFIIATNRTEVNANVYNIDAAGEPVAATYGPGTVSERNESFSDITGLLSPETSYNLRLSPARNARYHWPLLAVSLYKKPVQQISFQSGTGNYQMQSTQTDDCAVSEAAIAENGNIHQDSVVETYKESLYVPETLEFVVAASTTRGYFSFDDFLQAVANPTLQYQASCDGGPATDSASGSNYFGGYIKTLNYRPNKEGGFGEFLLQRK